MLLDGIFKRALELLPLDFMLNRKQEKIRGMMFRKKVGESGT